LSQVEYQPIVGETVAAYLHDEWEGFVGYSSALPLPDAIRRVLYGAAVGRPGIFSVPLASTHPGLLQPLPHARGLVKAAEVAELRGLAARFTERAASAPFVSEIWVNHDYSEVVAVVDEPNFEEELRLHAVFVELASTLSDASLGDLMIVYMPWTPDENGARRLFHR
jgi:hypothetical protein